MARILREFTIRFLNCNLSTSNQPKCIVLDTVKGQGVPELETMTANHHLRPSDEQRAMLEKAKLVLGSATPSIESYYYAKKGLYQLIELNERYNQAKMPEIELVDMKEEKDFTSLWHERIQFLEEL